MAITEFSSALNQVASERNISPEEVINTLKEALVAAYRKDNPLKDDEELSEDYVEKVKAEIDPESGEVKITLEGKDITPAGFGRIASQTAKQVILQKIREAEKESLANEYRELVGTVTQGYIFRIDRDTVIMDVGKTQGVLPASERIPNERYMVNQKYKVLIKEVTNNDDASGSVIILSRKDPEFIKALFAEEVPEIASGVVTIKNIAREAGERTKIAVSSSDEKVDPSGACIGQRGIRVQAVTDELNGEKIDIINHSPDSDRFIASALAPAHVIDIILNVEDRSARVIVSEDQLSLAIGNRGQNARLAAKLTGFKINIEGPEGAQKEKSEEDDSKAKDKKEGKKKEEKAVEAGEEKEKKVVAKKKKVKDKKKDEPELKDDANVKEATKEETEKETTAKLEQSETKEEDEDDK